MISEGIVPTKPFPRMLRLTREPPDIVEGMVPLNLLSGMCNVPSKGFASKKKTGNVPVKPLLPKITFSNLDNRFQPSGIDPSRSSPEMTNVLSSDSMATSNGSDPIMLLPSGPKGPTEDVLKFEKKQATGIVNASAETYRRKAR